MAIDRTAVTVIVPTFNRANFLSECLASLTSQTVPLREIIVIDDGSTDGTREVATGFANVRYARQDNRGKSAALNHGLALATGEAVWIVDDDDIAAPEAAERLTAALGDAPTAGFAFGDFDRFVVDEAGERRFSAAEPHTSPLEELHWRQLMRCSIFQGAMLVRRACYDVVGPFDVDLPRAQDYDMLLRLTRRFPSVHVPAVMFHQRQHDGERGPGTMRIDGAAVWQRQSAFDAKVLLKARARAPVSAFLPDHGREAALSPADTIRALLRRAERMAQLRLWDAAGEDIAEAMAVATSGSCRALPEPPGAAFASCFRGDEQDFFHPDNPLLRVLAEDRTHPFRGALLRAVSTQPFLNGVKSFRRGRPVEGVRRMGQYFRMTQGAYLLSHLGHVAASAWAAAGRLAASPRDIRDPRESGDPAAFIPPEEAGTPPSRG